MHLSGSRKAGGIQRWLTWVTEGGSENSENSQTVAMHQRAERPWLRSSKIGSVVQSTFRKYMVVSLEYHPPQNQMEGGELSERLDERTKVLPRPLVISPQKQNKAAQESCATSGYVCLVFTKGIVLAVVLGNEAKKLVSTSLELATLA